MTTLRQAVQEFVADYDCGGCGHFAAYAERFRSSLAQPDNTTTLREAAQQALKALEMLGYPIAAITALRDALAQEEQGPVAWTDREQQLIDGMIEVQLHHAAQCDNIANRVMAEKQKGWDMERVALLRKIKSIPPRREWQGLTEEELLSLLHSCDWRRMHLAVLCRAIEAKLKEKNA